MSKPADNPADPLSCLATVGIALLISAGFAAADEALDDKVAAASAMGTLVSIEEDPRANDPTFVEQRCVDFFAAIYYSWMIAKKPYGRESDLLIIPENPFTQPSFRGGGLDRTTDDVQRYMNTFGGVDPVKNIQTPIFKADLATCKALYRMRNDE